MKRKATNTNGIIGSQYPESLAVEGRIPTYKPVVDKRDDVSQRFPLFESRWCRNAPLPSSPPKRSSTPFLLQDIGEKQKAKVPTRIINSVELPHVRKNMSWLPAAI